MAESVDQLVSGLDEIKASLKEISSCLSGITSQLAVHERRIETLEREHRDERAERKLIADDVRTIHDTCLQREDVWRRGKLVLDSGGADPQGWWNRMVTNGVMVVAGAVAGGVVAGLIGKMF